MVTSVSERILEAATSTVFEAGREALRVDEIARGAGANKRMIYHYFGNREGLLRAVCASQWEVLANAEISEPTLRFIADRLGHQLPVEAHGTSSDTAAHRALVILLPDLLKSVGRSISAEAWAVVAAELSKLMFPDQVISVERRKPTIRLRPVSKARDLGSVD